MFFNLLPNDKQMVTKSEFSDDQTSIPQKSGLKSTVISGWINLAKRIDIRILFIGSLLPDIIDKPIGITLLSNGRVFSHTLLFLLILLFGGLFLYFIKKRNWLLLISYGVFTHLLFDAMWQTPKTLFWPLFGLTFDRMDTSYWIPDMLRALIANPVVIVPELVGLIIILWFGLVLIQRNTVSSFLKYGRL